MSHLRREMDGAESTFKRWVPFAVFLCLCTGIVIGADRGTLSAALGWINSIPFFDKAGHIILIGTLAFLLNYALAGRRLGPLQLGGLIVAVVMTLEEYSQSWFPARTCSVADLMANYTGVLCAEIAWRIVSRDRRRS
ncbi:MAG: VanZ family protein [Chthoniobacterales bacterium]